MANFRGKRINEEVRKEVSDIIRNQIKDPRLTAMVSVTQVEVTKFLLAYSLKMMKKKRKA